jgi:quercetin dioxygenase-like cupin family protein
LDSGAINGMARGGAGAGTSGVRGIQTIILSGDPSKPGPYAIQIRVPPHTVIAAHSHRDDRFGTVISGAWYFGYGTKANPALVTPLSPGAFYTEPAGQAHFALTRDAPAVVTITGNGPTDTIYASPKDGPQK